MIDFFTRCNQWLSGRMFLIIFPGLVLGAFVPISNSPATKEAIIALFAYMTFVTALSTGFRQFAKVLVKPAVPLWILFLVHLITPFATWLLSVIFFPDNPLIRIGYLVGASIPIGVTSVIWTSLVEGNLPVALVAVTLDTFIVPVFLPLFLKIVAGHSVHLDYWDMVSDLLLMVTIPSVVGMVLYDLTHGRVASYAKHIGGFTSKLGLFAVILINSAIIVPEIHWDLSVIKVLLVTLVVVASGYLIGYLGSFALKNRNRSYAMTMIFNVGMRNIACGLVIALSYFPPTVALPLTLAMLYQQPLASFVPRAYEYLDEMVRKLSGISSN
jgi:predicted Na+-dependent transporter